LFKAVANFAEQKRLLTHAIALFGEREDDLWTARTLCSLSDANRMLGLHKEGMQEAREAVEIYERLGEMEQQRVCLLALARSLYDDGQFDAGEKAALHVISLLPERGEEYLACECYLLLGNIYRSRGMGGEAIQHCEEALSFASILNWSDQLFWAHDSLAQLFCDRAEFNYAHAHIEKAQVHAAEDVYYLGRAMESRCLIWYQQRRLENAMSEGLCALETFGKIGAVHEMEHVRILLRRIEGAKKTEVDLSKAPQW
jgi:tetratricopeptide (TPR) repeat protein